MPTFARTLFVCVVISFCASQFASAAILTSNDILRVRFTTSPAVPVPDVLDLHLGVVQVLQAHTSRTGALYDGNTLLGVGTSTSFGGHVGALSLQPARSWRSPTSVYTFENPAVADFTTIQNGTIDGRIDFTIQTGSMDINLSSVRVSMGFATGPVQQLLSNPQPVLTSVEIIPIPEPTVGMIVALSLPALLRRRRAA